MKVLACTGGIGSGKTYVASVFACMGVPVYDSDYQAKLLYDRDSLLLEQMLSLLGSEILKNGVLQREIIACKIFNDKELLVKVERIVHPAVVRDFNDWKEQIVRQNGDIGVPFVIFESAIILEKPLVRGIADKILTVSAPLEVRVERVMKRDCVSMERVMERIAVQWDDNKRESMADFIIFADGKRAVLPQVIAVEDAMRKF